VQDLHFLSAFIFMILGKCPGDWNDCAIVLRSDITFSHMNALESSQVQYEFYSIKLIMPNGLNVVNVGIASTSTQVQVVISGVPVGEIIRDNQIRYFEDTTKLFLDKFTGSMAVFSVDVQSGSKRTVVRVLADEVDRGALRCVLDVNGAYPVVSSIDDFNDAIIRAFEVQAEVFIAMLKQNGIRPSEKSDGNGFEYFQGINSITSKIKATSDRAIKHD
jgi:hypothetical protein